jgi:abequosyltransferase
VPNFLLTICIATFNRSDLLCKTLENIASQALHFNDVEILIADGNSTDSTELICNEFSTNYKFITYLKLAKKGGVDKDYDLAIQHSRGKYCWLFTDDDLLKPDAIKKIRELLLEDTDFIVINSEICNYKLDAVLKKSAMDIKSDFKGTLVDFGWDRFFKICSTYITFIGSLAIKRDLWLAESRHSFYGSRFIHVGVISTVSDSTKFIIVHEPLIKIRLGNAEWSNISFKVWVQLWPNLIWSLSRISDETKKFICAKNPSKNLKFLFWLSALGH